MPDSPAPHPTLVNWEQNTQLQMLASSETLGWNHVHVFIERQPAMPENIHVPYLEDDVLALILDGSPRVYTHLVGGRSFNTPVGAQTLQLVPRHSEFIGRWDATWTYAVFRLNRDFVCETAAAIHRGDPSGIELLPTFYFNDPLLYHLGAKLTNEMRRANPLGLMYAEALINAFTLHLLRNYSTGRAVRDSSGGRLTPAQLRMVNDYIHAHLDSKISLADLAACLHLSVPHFERMFRTTTQRPPYQYILEIRVELARVLLEKTRLPLAEVAHQCGFSSQSHFTAHFSRYFGISPARFARGIRL